MSTKESVFSPAYQHRLNEQYDPQITDEIVNNWHYAELPDQPGEKIAYVRLNQGASEKPVIYSWFY
jgi:ribonucleotide reductase beta subunit family protein with ferritin-like domain